MLKNVHYLVAFIVAIFCICFVALWTFKDNGTHEERSKNHFTERNIKNRDEAKTPTIIKSEVLKDEIITKEVSTQPKEEDMVATETLENDKEPSLIKDIEEEIEEPEIAVTTETFLPAMVEFNDWFEQTDLANGSLLSFDQKQRGVELAIERRKAMKELIQIDPKMALENKMSARVRNLLPDEIKEHLEENVSGKGMLAIAIETPEDVSQWPKTRHMARVKDKLYGAYVYGRRVDHPTRKGISLHGIAIDGHMAVDESPVRVVEKEELTEADYIKAETESCVISGKKKTKEEEPTVVEVEGEKKFLCGFKHIALLANEIIEEEEHPGVHTVNPSDRTTGNMTCLYIRVQFADQASEPQSYNSSVSSMNAVDSFFRANSFGKLSWTFNIIPTIVLPKAVAYYGADWVLMANHVETMAREQGYDINDYDHYAIRWNGGPGKFSGLAHGGAPGTFLKSSHIGVACHEFGHNLGLLHARYWQTNDGSAIGEGNSVDYGDSFDVMGAHTSGGHFNVAYKNILGWIPDENAPTVTTSGVYQLYAFDTGLSLDATKKYAYRIKKESLTDVVYWLGFRQNITSNSWLMNGINLNLRQEGISFDLFTASHLIDTTPKSSGGRQDSAIVIGRTFSDVLDNVHITPIAKGGTTPESLIIDVQLGEFPDNLPPISTISASSTNVAVNESITFTSTATDPNGDALAYYWDFGDDNVSMDNQATQTRSFSENGIYTVRCEVSDRKGGVHSQHVLITVGTPDKFQISGKVVDEVTSVPIANAVVTWGNVSTFTDSNGVYQFNNLDAGSNPIKVFKDFHTFTVDGFANPVAVGPSATVRNFKSKYSKPKVLPVFVITANSGENGSIWPSGAVSVKSGESQQFVFPADSGFEVDKVLVNGENKGAIKTFTISNVTSNQTIEVSFKPIVLTVTASAGPNGSISPSGAMASVYRGSQPFLITPDEGYVIDKILVNGSNRTIPSIYPHTFVLSNITANSTVSVTFKQGSNTYYTIQASAGSGGKITPSGNLQVLPGSSLLFTAEANEGYVVESLFLDGYEYPRSSPMRFATVGLSTNKNSTVHYSFKKGYATNNVTATSDSNGKISPEGVIAVNEGFDQTFTMTPNAGYEVASVKVNGVSVGRVTEYTFANVTSIQTISVTYRNNTSNIVASSGANGSISPSGTIVLNANANQTFTMLPNVGYEVSDVKVNGVSVGAVTSHTFTDVISHQSIAVTYKKIVSTITAKAGANGKISPEGVVTVDFSKNKAFTITPDTGYAVLDVRVNGASVGAVKNYTFTNVTTNHTIEATFKSTSATTYNVVASSDANGSITPSGNIVVSSGSNQTFTMTPKTNYEIADVKVGGISVGAVTSHTITNITSNKTIAVTYKLKTFKITATTGANGNISPKGAVVVNSGTNKTFTMTPNANYEVAEVKVNGLSVGAVTNYEFKNVTSDQTIAVTYKIKTFTIKSTTGSNGDISPKGDVVVNSGTSKTFTMTPKAGYEIDDVKVNGTSVGKVTSHTIANVTSNQTIAVTYKIKTFKITATTGANGDISPKGDVMVDSGASQVFTMTPKTGYEIDDVKVNGSSVGKVKSHIIVNVASNQTIAVTYKQITTTTKYNIVASSDANGSISPSGTVSVDSGASQTFTMVPKTGYEIDDVKVNGTSVGKVTSHTITNVTSNQTIAVTYKLIPTVKFNIVASSDANGSISPSGTVSVNSGASQTFTMTPKANYEVADVKVNGQSVGAVTSHTIINVTSNQTIAVTYKIKTFKITATTSANGNISPKGDVVVNSGTNKTFTMAPNTNYEVADVKVNGSSVGAVTSYEFKNVTSDQTIAVTYKIKTFKITASTGANGNISPKGDVVVNSGTNKTFTMAPNANYEVADVKVNNVSVGAVTSYEFKNVTSNQTIAVTFKQGGTGTYSTVQASAGTGGKITPAGSIQVLKGTSKAFTIESEAGYVIDTITFDGEGSPRTTSDNWSMFVFNATKDVHTIHASFRVGVVTRTITATSGPNGTISPSGVTSVTSGSSQTFTMTPDAGYEVEDVKWNGVSIGKVTSHTMTNVTVNQTISVTYKKIGTTTKYNIVASSDANGSISPSGTVSVNSGANQTFTMTPKTGYEVADVKVNGINFGAVTSHTILNVTSNQTIVVTYKAKGGHTIVSSAGANGSITSLGSTVVANGGSKKYDIIASAGYAIDDVIVDGVSKGALTTYTFSNVNGSHTIHASFKIKTYTIVSSAGSNGSISPAGSVAVNHGASRSFTITANGGFEIENVLVNGVSVGAVASYSFPNVTKDHTIVASFKAAPVVFTVEALASGNGKISPSGNISVTSGATQVFTFLPDAGYEVDKITVDGVVKPTANSFEFKSVSSNHKISVSFKLILNGRVINASAGSNGSISPIGNVMVANGADQVFTITPNGGYEIADVKVNGTSVGAVASYGFTNVTSAQSIEASFVKSETKPFVIKASAGSNGSISPSGEQTVSNGADITFHIKPDSGFEVSGILVDGASVPVSTSYSFVNVSDNHEIHVNFSKTPLLNTFTLSIEGTSGGVVTPSGELSLAKGANQTVSAQASSGFFIKDFIVDGKSLGGVKSHTFSSIASDHNIQVVFEKALVLHEISSFTSGNGQITPNGVVSVKEGDSQTYFIQANPGSELQKIEVDGVNVGKLSQYQFTNVTKTHTIQAFFIPVKSSFSIKASAGANGSISPSGDVLVEEGQSASFVFTPNTGFKVSDVLVNGVSVGAKDNYTFNDVRNYHSIHVLFEQRLLDETRTLLSFSFNGLNPISSGIIVGNKVEVFVPKNTNLSGLVASFTYKGVSVKVDGVAQISGVSKQNFNTTKTYVVASESGHIREYEVSVFSTVEAGAGVVGFAHDRFLISPDGLHVVVVLRRSGGSKGRAVLRFIVEYGDLAKRQRTELKTVIWEDGDSSDKTVEVPLNGSSLEAMQFRIDSVDGAGVGTTQTANGVIDGGSFGSGSGNENQNLDDGLNNSGGSGAGNLEGGSSGGGGCHYNPNASSSDQRGNIAVFLMLMLIGFAKRTWKKQKGKK